MITNDHVKIVAYVVGASLVGLYAAGFTYSPRSPFNKPAPVAVKPKAEPWIMEYVQPGTATIGKKHPATHIACLYKVTAAHAALSTRDDRRIAIQYMHGMLDYCEGVIIERPDGQRIRWNERD